MNWKVLPSNQDKSVNFVQSCPDGGSIECRFVQRSDDYFIVYLSSHTGCRHACRFCHLTATGQTTFSPVTLDQFVDQAQRVWAFKDTLATNTPRMHYNWMARGEALSNPCVVDHASDLIGRLSEIALARETEPKFNISTIMPIDLSKSLVDIFSDLPVTLYYSLYSVQDAFRKRWLPRSLPAAEALVRLSEWQQTTSREIVLHWAFIADENDSEADVHALCDAVQDHDLRVRVNLVRYNPANDKSRESDESVIIRNLNIIQERLSRQSKIVPRVGFDVKASCGMFVSE